MFLPLSDVFGDDELAALFGERSYVAAWLEVERALAAAQAALGDVPAEAVAAIEAAARPEHVDLGLLRERTRVVGYPILPLLEQVSARDPAAGRHLHWGATTQDVMDSGLALVCARAFDRVDELLRRLGDAVARLADEHRATPMPGRTHAQPAVPVTLGAKLAVWLAELARHQVRLRDARGRLCVVQLFGAAGSAAALGPRSREVRHEVAARLGLGIADVPWHVARDGIAEAAFALAALAGTCGKLGREVVELSRPEIGELREEGGHLRGASSTMPQKTNPIGSEAAIGLSLLAAQQVGVLLVAMQAPHERAAGEWQAEWDALALAFGAAGGAVARAGDVVHGLRVFPERMRANLDADGGTVMAEAAMMALARVTGRADAHDLVYEAAALARADGVPLAEALGRTLEQDVLAALPPLEEVLDPARYLGESERVVDAALERWRDVTHGAEAGTARP